MAYRYTVEIWEALPPDKVTEKNGLKIDHEVTLSKSFWNLTDAWLWVIDNKIKKYTVYRGECIIDNS